MYELVTSKELNDIINSLKNKNSCGYNGIPIRIIK
jgi:hypothetical protein